MHGGGYADLCTWLLNDRQRPGELQNQPNTHKHDSTLVNYDGCFCELTYDPIVLLHWHREAGVGFRSLEDLGGQHIMVSSCRMPRLG